MTTISILNVKRAPSGKSLIVEVAGRKEGYFAKLDSGLEAGMTVEAETKASEWKGKTSWWIEKWKNAPATGLGQAPASGQQTRPDPSQTGGEGRFTAEGINLAFLPFVSNVVAHAIAAGKVEGPAEISAWADAAYTAACNLRDATKSPEPF